MHILFVLNLSSVTLLAVGAIAGFLVGLLYKKALVLKQKKRILRLEDEMLTNHSAILSLEKKLVEAQKEKSEPDYNLSQPKQSDRNLKAS